MDSEYSQSDSCSSDDSGTDSEGSLCDFIVNDEVDSTGAQNNDTSTNEDEENELDSIVNDLREDERALLSVGRPKRKRKQTVRYIDPDYCRLMELDTLSQREVDYIMNGSARQKKSRKKQATAARSKPAKAKTAKAKTATNPKISKAKISKKKIRALKTNN